MRIQINDTQVTIPSSLREITLRQRIDFQSQYGNELDLMSKSISEIEDEQERELEVVQFQFEKMFRTVAFFTKTDVAALKSSSFIEQIAQIYFANLAVIFEEEAELTPVNKFNWQDADWYLAAPELKHGDQMAFGEMIDSKQMIQDMIGLGKNRWECLIPLAAIFLRKEDEPYAEAFLYEDSERLKLMEQLPLDIALQVGFFLISSLNIFTTAFQSLLPQELKEVESMSEVT